MVNYEIIGRRIKEERINKKISQTQFAKDLGVTTGYVSQIENGQKCFNLKRFEQVEKILDKPTSYFVEDSCGDDTEMLLHEIISYAKSMDSKKLQMVKEIVETIVNS